MKNIHTCTVLRKTDNRILGASVEELRASLCRIDTDKADVLGVCRFRVAAEDIPTRSGGDVTQGVGRLGILMRL